ncbi:hypothetical protein AT15_06430 [Kosmotoga arenicorallina S304]|uniref:asparagine synthase (glutamine-hydrolyzing) n=1 Tax=Kosmotoga arenicorallina S304 TaxID=1453497 RepID=A0A176JTK3_9BACT|nr:asparagine synthase C-terminal domain-containing protein [Kosmotoga arenicorallina]OAA26590.1 hypothetical protein AT15_06430 [Kosmotoga arenicorallina S304]
MKISISRDKWKPLSKEYGHLLVPSKAAIGVNKKKELEQIGMTYIYSTGSETEINSGIVKQQPLFIDKNNLEINDSIENDNYRFQENAVLELLSFGYVLGNNTLIDDFRQIIPGQKMIINNYGKIINTSDEYKNLPRITNLSETEFEENFFKTLMKVFEQALYFSEGKRILIPLSGGYDSRLIACILKELNVNNVVCVSYGVPGTGNVETDISEEVARRLGYEWVYISYDFKKLRKSMRSQKFTDYLISTHNFSSLPHIQEFLAFEEIEKHFGNEEFIIAPGHSADFSAGSHLTALVEKAQKTRHLEDVFDAIVAKHFVLRKLPIPETIKIDLMNTLVEFSNYIDEPYRIFEVWDWYERQAKFIVNSIRLYEFFGHCWWLPFWDKRFIDFWMSVPFEHKLGKKLYDRFVQKIFEKHDVNFDISSKTTNTFKKKTESLIIKLLGGGIGRKLRELYMKRIYKNPWGIDKIAKEILDEFGHKYATEKEVLDKYINVFKGRSYDPNCYLSEILLLVLMNKSGVRSCNGENGNACIS